MLHVTEVVILALVQGIAEFLPISSSGHLVVVSQFVGDGRADAGLNILLHAGTLGSILVHYRRDLFELLGRQRRLVPLLVLGTLPALLLAARWIEARADGLDRMPVGRSLFIGVAQALALLPGVSRSGSTIVAGLACGLERRAAATWAFLLAVPAIAGASTLEAVSELTGGDGGAEGAAAAGLSPGLGALGFALSFLVGLVSLRIVLRVVEAGHLHWFALWCAAVGGFVLIAV